MNSKQKLLAAVVGGALASLGFGIQSSQAALTLKFIDGANPAHFFNFADDGAGDMDGDLQSMAVKPTASGVTGINTWGFKSALTTATSSDLSDDNGAIQLSSIAVRNTTGTTKTFTIVLKEDGFDGSTTVAGPRQLNSSIAVTFLNAPVTNKVIFQSYMDPDGPTGPALPTALATAEQAVWSGGGLQSSAENTEILNFTRTATPYTLWNVTTITLSAGAQANISATTSVIPEPTSFAAAAALVSALLMGRRRREVEE